MILVLMVMESIIKRSMPGIHVTFASHPRLTHASSKASEQALLFSSGTQHLCRIFITPAFLRQSPVHNSCIYYPRRHLCQDYHVSLLATSLRHDILRVAEVLEKRDIEPFTTSLSTFSSRFEVTDTDNLLENMMVPLAFLHMLLMFSRFLACAFRLHV